MPAQKVQALQWRAAVESVVVPLVRALRKQGMSQPQIAALLADVSRRAAGDADESGAASPTLSYAAGTRLVSRWRSDRMFSDAGIPRPLSLKGSRSFEALARAAKVDPAAARAALQRLGMVRISRDRIVLRADHYVPAHGTTEKLDILGRDGAEFIRTMVHNVNSAPGRAFLQRKASYDNIGGDSVQGLLTALRRQGMDALMSADAMLAKVDRDRNPSARGGRRMRVSFGVYCCSEPVSAAAPRTKKAGRRRRVS
jgi:hypothetical protein